MKAATSLKDKIEITTNLLIIVVLVLIGGSYVKARLGHHQPGLSAGERIVAPLGYDWHKYGQTLVVAVRKGCIYCEHSYPLYRERALEYKTKSVLYKQTAQYNSGIPSTQILFSTIS